ncbi:minor tail protein [Mycobacterium phage DrLupo]|uniref:Minor tail protein n=1 Tax=Mycobacterium phage DrLupo TaxID=2499037 RepID=A0A3S9UQK9_9CAUD|nr:minor tail protein [Mycobacterium phage DrLupo]AZS12573.1 minor tail protein [Mycobacterium phage DrLupo]
MITDRLRWTVIEANTNRILTRDLNVVEPEVMIGLSEPSHMAFKLPPTEQYRSSAGIDWKTNGQLVVCEIEIDYERRVFGIGITQAPKIDPASGTMQVELLGPMGYPKGEPWLENFNPIAVDPAEVFQRVWAYLQSFSNAQLGIEVTPASTGTQMLPGYGYDGSILSFDFFAMFIRAVDLPDAGDVLMGLARDIPLDMFERAWWNEDRTELTRKIEIAYPYGGLHQDHLAFRSGENIVQAELAEEMDIEPVSDIIIRSWLPGKMMSARLSNADPTRYRKTAIEEDAKIDSTERAMAWAKRKLQRRNIPLSFSKITVIPDHPHAPFGTYDVGDSIFVEYYDYPWKGDIQQWHRITSITYDQDAGIVELGLKVEGAFNYDPIEYNPDWEEEPHVDPNRLFNGYFDTNLSGWKSNGGQWFRVGNITFDTEIQPNAGSVRVDLDDNGARFRSSRAHVVPGETLSLMAAVRWQEVEINTGAFRLMAHTSYNGTAVGSFVVDEYVNPSGTHAFELLTSNWTVPEGVNEVALEFIATPEVQGGMSWWTYARVIPA